MKATLDKVTDKLQTSKLKLPILGTFLTLTAFAVSSSVIPPLITTIADEISANYTSFGYIIMSQFFGFFLAGTIGGWICERHNVNSRVFVITGLLIVVITFLVGSSLTKLPWFVIWALPLGIGGGLIETFGSILISHLEKNNSSKLQNMAQVFFCIGAVSAPQVVAFLLYFNIRWESMFIVFAIFILLMMFIFLWLTKDSTNIDIHQAQTETNFQTPLLKDSLLFLLAATLLAYVTFESVTACWIPVYFEKHLSCTAPSAAIRLSVFWGGLIVGRLAMIVIPRRFTLWPAMFVGATIMFISAFLASFTLSPFLVTILVFINGLGAGPVWPTTIAICHTARKRPKFTSVVIAFGAIGVVTGSGLGAAIFKLDPALYFPTIAVGSIILLILITISYKASSKPLPINRTIEPNSLRN